MLSTFNLFVVAIILFVIVLVQHVKKRSRHPPGPLGLPYVGMFPFQLIQILFAKYLPKVSELKIFRQMKEKYGEIWSMEMGGQRIVGFASIDILNESFFNKSLLFSGRPSNEVFNKITDCQGIMLIDGPMWRDNRQMAIKTMRDLGMGKRDLEVHIIDEGNMLVDYMHTLSPEPVHTELCFTKSVSNVISRLVFNSYNKYGDPQFEKFVEDLQCALGSEVIDSKCNLFPKFFSTKLARCLFADVEKFFVSWEDIRVFVLKKCEKRKLIQNDSEEPSCVFDHFWRFRYVDEPDIKEDRKMNEIYHCMADLYMAGTETTNTLLGYCILMLARYEEAQKEIRTELQGITDDYRLVNMSMKLECPKLLSFIDEVQRYCCLVTKFPRRVMKKCTFRGYELYPEDIIIGDFGTIAKDKTLFENPDQFDALRFMDASKTKYVSSPHMVPFGVGKRSCIGESIATMELFLFLSRLILVFNISMPIETTRNYEDILDGKSGFVHGPLEHTINFKPL